MLGLIIACVVILPMSMLLLVALLRMEKLKSVKVAVKFSPLPVLSFEADAGDEKKERPPLR